MRDYTTVAGSAQGFPPMKYLIATTATGVKVPVIFPEFIEHADIAVALSEILKDFTPYISSMGRVSLDKVSISEGATADGLEIICHDHFNSQNTDSSIN
jgi:hypothetical protein